MRALVTAHRRGACLVAVYTKDVEVAVPSHNVPDQ
jgi:ATP-dependent Clp protease adapter protein ClpS